jgi:signal transduction histidine kinase
MNVRSLPLWAARWWPQRVRTRMTLLYGGLFLVAGSALLGLTYGLLSSSLPVTSHQDRLTANEKAKIVQACKQKANAVPTKGHAHTGFIPAKALTQCESEFAAGANAGSASQRNQTLNDLLLFSFIGLGAMTIASGYLGWIVSGRVLRPVRTITETARRASDQHLGERLDLSGPKDELRELADTFDDMLDRLDAAFTSQKRFVANASHELRTPLTAMRTAIDVTLAKPGRTPQQLEEMAVRVRRSIDGAEGTIDALLTLATSEQRLATRESVDLATAAEDAVDAAGALIALHDLHLDATLEPAPTTGDPFLLERMVSNLVDNAVRHNGPHGWIRISTGTTPSSTFFRISNSGPLVADNEIESLFEPFGRAEARLNPRAGVGLGLSIVRSIVAAHGGSISASGETDGGLSVVVDLSEENE